MVRVDALPGESGERNISCFPGCMYRMSPRSIPLQYNTKIVIEPLDLERNEKELYVIMLCGGKISLHIYMESQLGSGANVRRNGGT